MATPPEGSVDSIIGWLKERRRDDPSIPLSQLLQERPVRAEYLVDLACIDLMQRRRNDQSVYVEDYLQDLPELGNDTARLDLIDAEICVDRERGRSAKLARYADRFPDLRLQIDELLHMDPLGPADLVADRGHLDDRRQDQDIAEPDSSGQSLEFSLAPAQPHDVDPSSPFPIGNARQPETTSSAQRPHPIDIPEWFIGEQCVASSPGHWLIRGRDAQHGQTLAMKVIELPAQITARQVDEMLDECEKAAKVRNSAWVVPVVAAVQQRHLAVVRTWIFGNPWQHVSHNLLLAQQLKHLASIAYALQSAHRSGAAHGAVHAANILVDHEGQIHLVDGCSGSPCVRRWLSETDHVTSWGERRMLDVQDMIKLVVSDAVDWPRGWADQLVSQLRCLAQEHGDEACGRIGDALMRWADQPGDDLTSSSSSTTLRERIANWISRAGQ